MRLKELRKSRRLKQTDIAEILSCSQGVYSRYESEEREPPFDIIKKLAEYYDVTIDYLMGGEDTKERSEPTQQNTNISASRDEEPTLDAQTDRIIQMFGELDPENRAFIETLIKHAYEATKKSTT
jgi:transcriptional regulator with XRE-family HTH domain